MLNALIRYALSNRLMIVGLASAVIVGGSIVARSLPIDVLPDLTRPRVVLITECQGMAPEEVETLVTIPLETSVNGAAGVQAVRSSSDIGLSIIYVEFDWGADIYTARQIVQERIATVSESLPDGIRPTIGPVSSLLGQIMLVGMWSENGETDPLELRTQADWVVRTRLLTIPGVSQVITVGGERKQYQVLTDPHALHQYNVSLHDVELALQDGNLNVTGGYLNRDARELLVRGIGRIRTIDDIEDIVVRPNPHRSVQLKDVARVVAAGQVKRGDSTVNGTSAVVLNIQKQPDADTRALTNEILAALDGIRQSLPDDVVLQPTYLQRDFINHSVRNVVEAVRDGAILVVVILFLFLLNFRTTLITLTAIPLSILTTALVFRWFGMSINIMTLGGLAVALGELVDDAIVDVENIFHRLRDNARCDTPRPFLRVIYDASREVRGAIIMSTVIVVLVFAPLFALSGIQGRLFAPLGVAYIVSIVASTLVSLTVTPVLSFYLLPNARATRREGNGPVLQTLKRITGPLIRLSMTRAGFIAIVFVSIVAVIGSGLTMVRMGRNFLPPFDEGAIQVNLYLPPGTSLDSTKRIASIADRRFRELLKTSERPNAPLESFTCRMGRAELDEHVMGVNVSEYIMSLNTDSGLRREEMIRLIDEKLDELPGVEHEVEQPVAHLMSHMLSGVTAQIAIKLFGDDLDVLRRKAAEIEHAIEDIDGIADPVVEQQTIIPQLRVELRRDQLAFYGLSAKYVNEFIETALNGRTVSRVLEGQRVFDLLLRLDEASRQDYVNLHRMPIETPDGGRIPLSAVARVIEGGGPNTIAREDARRRIVIRVNTQGRDLGSAVAAIQTAIRTSVELDPGYFVVYAGQFEAQQAASRRILWLSGLALAGMFLVLYTAFPSTSIVLQILMSIPAAFVGGVLAIVVTGQTPSVASMVGFISLGGIAARNGILLISTYSHRLPDDGFTREMILRGSQDRLAPVLMTALTTGIGLAPLVVSGHLPGREILFPVATVIVGGLITSTVCEFLIRPGLFWFATNRELFAEMSRHEHDPSHRLTGES